MVVRDEVHNLHGLLFDALSPVELADVLQQQVQRVCCAPGECDMWVPASRSAFIVDASLLDTQALKPALVSAACCSDGTGQ